ncbi:hypothetical protein CCUS01_07775 [Colletotrichum cuscutae]|uniref:Uncharacterized protein n=1 Tax=Colletotrichum cuscutae TaxID=1209917 RepID=A0AAI9XYD8_9PEZI|nr:hypothetical protein CCUS01_07775 [Colletotrichum cuscutae]
MSVFAAVTKERKKGRVVDAARKPEERKTGRTELGREGNWQPRCQSVHQREKEACIP